MPVLINKETGQAFEVEDAEVETASRSMGLVPATQEQIDWLQKQREYDALPVTDKLRETGQAYAVGLGKIGRELGRFRLDDTGLAQSLFPDQAQQVAEAQKGFQERRDATLDSQAASDVAERHPLAYALGVDTPALFISPGVGGSGLRALGGMAAESAAVGLSEEAVARTDEGRDFDLGNAAEIAAYDFAFSGLASAATKVASRVGNLLMFGAGNTTAKNVKRGLDESAGPVVPDDVRFDGPLLEAETRSRRTAAAQGPGMPPGPERDELLRRSAADLNDQVKTEGGDLLDSTLSAARASASVADDAVSRRIDETLRETTPAQTAWSADATRKLDEMRTALDATADEASAPFVARAREAADEAIAAIDSSGESASWFRASSKARESLDSLADDIAASGLPAQPGIEAAREFLGRSLTDRALFGGAAEMHAGLHGLARDKIASAVKITGGDMRNALGEFVSADAATRQTLRRPIEQAIEGFEELANAHERFGTGSPKVIESLRDNAAKLRRGLKLADDVQSAQRSAPKAPPRPPPAPAAKEPDFARADTVADQIRQKAAKAGVAAAQKVVDYAAGPGRAVYDDAVSDALKGAIQSVAAIGGLAVLGPPGFVAGWLGARELGKKYAPKVGQQILDAAQRYVKKHGADTAGAALLASAALGESEDDSGAIAASVAGLGMLARRSMFRLGKRSALPASRAARDEAIGALGDAISELPETALDFTKKRSVAAANAEATAAAKTLTDAEREALNEYTRQAHSELRAFVQGEDVAPELIADMKRHVPNLESSIRKMIVSNPTQHGTIYRGMSIDVDALSELMTQDRYVTAAPASASYDANVARGFALGGDKEGPVILRFNSVDEGAPLLNSGASRAIGEWEVLLPRNQEYRVTGRSATDDGIIVIDLEQVGKADKIDLSEVGMLGLLGAAAAQGVLGGEDSDTLAASVGGLFFAKRFAERALGSAGRGVKAAGKGAYRASEAVAGTVDAATGKVAEAVGQATYKAGRKVGEAIGSTADAVARKAADEEAVKRTISAGIRDPKRWLRRNTRGKIADKVAEYFGPRISKVAREWLEKRGNKSAQEVVDEAVTETAEAGRRDSALLEEHSSQSAAMVEDVGTQIRAALNETAEQKARALAAFPQRIGGDANAQRQLLSSAVDELATALGKVSDGSTAKVAIEFANAAKEAIINARTAKDRFRIGMQLTETLVHHTAEVGDSEMSKVFGAYADKMWEAMGQREVWMGARELQREMKRVAKKRESLISKISAGEKIGIAALVGSAAVEDEDTAAALAATGGMGALVGKGKLMKLAPDAAKLAESMSGAKPSGKLWASAADATSERTLADGLASKYNTAESYNEVLGALGTKLDIEQQRALKNWSGYSYKELQGNLAGETATKVRNALDAAVQSGLTVPGEVSRGVMLTADELNRLKASKEFESPAFMATSANRNYPKTFLANKADEAKAGKVPVVLQVHQTSGVPIPGDPREAEILLRPGTKFDVRVVRDEVRKGQFEEVVHLFEKTPDAVDPRQLGTIPPKGKAKRPDGPIAAKPERDATPTKFYPNSNQARNEYGENMRPYREAQRADNTRMAQLAKDYGLAGAGVGAAAMSDDESGAAGASLLALPLFVRGGKRLGLLDGLRELDTRLAPVKQKSPSGGGSWTYWDDREPILKELFGDATGGVAKLADDALAKLDRAGIDIHAPGVEKAIERELKDSLADFPKKVQALSKQAPDPDAAPGAFADQIEGKFDDMIEEMQRPPNMKEALAAMRESVSKEGRADFKYYQGGMGFRMNEVLRGAHRTGGMAEEIAEGKAQDVIGYMTQAIEDGATAPGLVTRGVKLSEEEVQRLKSARVLTAQGIMSTSPKTNVAKRFATASKEAELSSARRVTGDKPVLFEVEQATGVPLSADEVAMRPGTQFKVLSMTERNMGTAKAPNMVPVFRVREIGYKPGAKSDAIIAGGLLALGAGGAALSYADDASASEPEETPEPDDRTVAANRILAIDQAATQRIRHTARVLAGLAEPPSPEGLTTRLARFGAEHDDPRAAFEERKDVLTKSEISPALVYDVLGASMGDVASVSPELYQAATARLLDNFRYLRENLPPEVKTSLLHPRGMPVSESAMRDFATQWNTAMDPESVLDDIERGTVTNLQIETLRNAHPDIYQQMRTEIIEEVGANFASIPTSTKMQLDILFQADGLAGPMFSSEAAAIIGAAGKAASQRKQPGPPQTGADDQDAAASSNGLEAIRSSVTNRGA